MKKIACLLMVLTMAFFLTACDKLVERGLKKQMTLSRADMLTDGSLHVVLVGTGGPFPNTERVSVATAVIAGGEFILVDTGPGTVRNALLQRLPMGSLSAVFLTHFHSDHIADLGEANMYSWVQGNRKKRLEVFGPPGVEKVVEGFAFRPYDPGFRPAELVDRNGLKAWAFSVDHFRPGHRFATRKEGGDHRGHQANRQRWPDMRTRPIFSSARHWMPKPSIWRPKLHQRSTSPLCQKYSPILRITTSPRSRLLK